MADNNFRPNSEAFGRLSDNRLFQFAAFVALAGFYFLGQPNVHFVSPDGFFYALIAERCPLLQHCEISNGLDTRSVLFHAINRALFVLARSVNTEITGFSIIVFVSSVCGALTWLLLARLLQRGAGLNKVTAWLAAACLGLSYGFWLNAGSAELYTPSICFTLLVLNLIVDADMRPNARWTAVLGAGVIAGLSVLFYRPNVTPLFLAIPALFMSRQRIGWLLAYGAAGTAVVVTGLLSAYLVSQPTTISTVSLFDFVFRRSTEFTGIGPFFDNPIIPLLRIGQNIGATNWVFSVESFAQNIQFLFPNWNFDDEVFAARQFRPFAYLPLLILPVLTIAFLMTNLLAVRRVGVQRPNRLMMYFGVSFVFQAVIIIGLAPITFDAWVPTLLPLVALFAFFILGPAIKASHLGAPTILVASFFLFNFFGGTGVLLDKRGDLHAAKASWLLENATTRDLVLLSEASWGFLNYLRYVVDVRVAVLSPSDAVSTASRKEYGPERIDRMVRDAFHKGGRLFVFEGILNPTPRLAHKSMPLFAITRDVGARLKNRANLVHESPIGKIYEIREQVP